MCVALPGSRQVVDCLAEAVRGELPRQPVVYLSHKPLQRMLERVASAYSAGNRQAARLTGEPQQPELTSPSTQPAHEIIHEPVGCPTRNHARTRRNHKTSTLAPVIAYEMNSSPRAYRQVLLVEFGTPSSPEPHHVCTMLPEHVTDFCDTSLFLYTVESVSRSMGTTWATPAGGDCAGWPVVGSGERRREAQVKARVVSDPPEPGQLQLYPVGRFDFAVIVLLRLPTTPWLGRQRCGQNGGCHGST